MSLLASPACGRRAPISSRPLSAPRRGGDEFGWSVGVSGDTVVVGAYNEDSDTTGVNSTPNEVSTNSGAAYVFADLGGPTPTSTNTHTNTPTNTPTPQPLGNYPPASILLSTNTTVTPDAAPTNTTSISVATSTNFKGKLDANPVTGVVRVTDAHPAGTYTVTVRAFNGPSLNATKTFMLTVTTPATCNPVSFAPAVNFAPGTGPLSVAVGDFDGDGNQDLAVAHVGTNNVSIMLGNGSGGISSYLNFGAGTLPDSVAVGDFNGDGKQDVAAANLNSGNVSVLLGDGTGSMSAATN